MERLERGVSFFMIVTLAVAEPIPPTPFPGRKGEIGGAGCENLDLIAFVTNTPFLNGNGNDMKVQIFSKMALDGYTSLRLSIIINSCQPH